MNVSSCATSSLDNRQAKPGMPKGEGAAVVPGRALPANTKRMREFGSWASAEELPAICGSAFGLPAPSVWWHAAQLSSYSCAPRLASCPFASAAAVAGFAAHLGAGNPLPRVGGGAQRRNNLLLRPKPKAIADIAPEVDGNPAADLLSSGEKG